MSTRFAVRDNYSPIISHRPKGVVYWYSGRLTRGLVDKNILKGLFAFYNQKNRCAGSFGEKSANYVSKGIRVYYSKREFMGWWVQNYSKEAMGGQKISVGRINHDAGYSFDNIKIETCSENSRECFERNKIPFKEKMRSRLRIKVIKDGEWSFSLLSVRDGARHFNVSQRLVQFSVRGKIKKSRKIPYKLEFI